MRKKNVARTELLSLEREKRQRDVRKKERKKERKKTIKRHDISYLTSEMKVIGIYFKKRFCFFCLMAYQA